MSASKDQKQDQPTSDAAAPTTKVDVDAKESPSADAARERKMEALRAENRDLEKELANVREQRAEVLKKLKNPSPEATVKQHIKLLHDFNDIRDVGLGLIGLVAENRQVRVQDVMPEFGVSPGD